MAKARVEVEGKNYYRDIHFLYEIINALKTVDEVKLFFKDILTKSELRMLKRRWHIASLLYQGLDIRKIAFMSKTSTQTVCKIKHILEEGQGGLKLAILNVNKRLEKEKNKSKKRGGSKFVKNWFDPLNNVR